MVFDVLNLLAWVCMLPMLWVGRLASQFFLCCLHNMPAYRAERLAAASHLAAKDAELAAKEAELAALRTTGKSAQSALDAAHNALITKSATLQALQQKLGSNADQFRQRLRAQEQQHRAAMLAC